MYQIFNETAKIHWSNVTPRKSTLKYLYKHLLLTVRDEACQVFNFGGSDKICIGFVWKLVKYVRGLRMWTRWLIFKLLFHKVVCFYNQNAQLCKKNRHNSQFKLHTYKKVSKYENLPLRHEELFPCSIIMYFFPPRLPRWEKDWVRLWLLSTQSHCLNSLLLLERLELVRFLNLWALVATQVTVCIKVYSQWAIAIVIATLLEWVLLCTIGLFTVSISDCDIAITKSGMGVAPI